MQETSRSFIDSFDGTRLAVYAAGDPDAPPMVLSNGLGGNIEAWRYVIAHFAQRYRFLTWDYRGLYASSPPPDGRAYDMRDHARDLEAVCDHFSVDRAVFFGWSMGVQLNYEYWRHDPERVAALVAINGTFGNPFRTALHLPMIEAIAPALLGVLRGVAPAQPYLTPLLAQAPLLLPLAKRVGLMGAGLREDVARELAAAYAGLDFIAYARIFEGLGRHTATDHLERIEAPTLVVAGRKDKLTPPKCSYEMAARIRGAELHVLREATHFAPIECPDEINTAIEDFVERRVSAPWGSRTSP